MTKEFGSIVASVRPGTSARQWSALGRASCLGVCVWLVASGFTWGLRGDETRYETNDGTTVRVTRRVEKRPVAEIHMEQRTETVYATEFVTEMHETARPVWVPVTQYVNEPRWQRSWNPFAKATVTYEPRAVTRWELRTQTVREPVTRQQQVPQERIVQIPVRSLGFVEKQQEERVVVGAAPANGLPTTPTIMLPLAPDVRYGQRSAPPIKSSDAPRFGLPPTSVGTPYRR